MNKEISDAIEQNGQPLDYIDYTIQSIRASHHVEIFYFPGEVPLSLHQELISRLTSARNIIPSRIAYHAFSQTHRVVAKKEFSDSGSFDIEYHSSNQPINTLTTEGNLIHIDVKDYSYDADPQAMVIYEPLSGVLIGAILGQDEPADMNAAARMEDEVIRELIASYPDVLDKAFKKAVELNIISQEELERVIALETTERVFLIDTVIEKVLKQYSSSKLLGPELGIQALMISGSRFDRYVSGQQTMGLLAWDGEKFFIKLYEDNESFYDNDHSRLIEHQAPGEKYDFFGNFYWMSFDEEKETVSFSVQRGSGTIKTITVPMSIPPNLLSEINDHSTHAWLNYNWVRAVKLERTS
jgi:hypothetical protein